MPLEMSSSKITDKKLSEDGLSLDVTISVSKQDLLDKLQEYKSRLDAEQTARDISDANIAAIQADINDTQSQLDLFG